MNLWRIYGEIDMSTAMSRYETYFRKYPPRPPLPPPTQPSPPRQLPFKVRTRTWTLPVLQPCSGSAMSRGYEERALKSPSPMGPTLNIQDLPLELLVQIFTVLAELENGTARAEIHHIRGIAYVMLVCRSWRALIVDTATFSKYITITTPQNDAWVSLCLERTQNCLLDIQVFTPGYASRDLLALVLPHASRIRSLTGHLSTNQQQAELLGPFFDAGLPALERLELIPIHNSKYGYYSEVVSHALERGTMPRLRYLAVQKTILPSPKMFWSSLRVLKLYYLPGGILQHSMVHLMQILAQNPFLQVLELETLPQASTPSTDGHKDRDGTQSLRTAPPQAILRDLHTLVIAGLCQEILMFTNFVSFPEDIANLDVRFYIPREEVTEEAVSAFLLPRFRPVLERMSDVMLNGSWQWPTRIYSPPRPSYSLLRSSTTLTGRICFSCGVLLRTSERETYLRGFARALSTISVRSLTVKVAISRPTNSPWVADEAWIADEAAAVDFWAGVFDGFPSVERLCILVIQPEFFRIDLVALLRALQPSSHGVEEGAAGVAKEHLDLPRCPLLTRLSIHGQFGNDADESLESLEGLWNCVSARARAGLPIHELDLHFWHHDWERKPLSAAHRSLLARIRSVVGGLAVCKFGLSPGCRTCFW